MSEKQSDKHIIPIVVGEYDSATRDKGLSSAGVKNNTPEGSPSIAGVENNSEKLSVFEKMGQVAAKAVHVIREAYAAERIDVDAKKPENDNGLLDKLGFPGNTENTTNNSGASEGTTDTSKPNAKPEAKKSKADTPQVNKNTNDGAKSTSEGTTDTSKPNAKPEAKKSKADTPQVNKNTNDGTKSTSGEQASGANKPEATKGKADNSPENNTNDGAKSTSGKQAPGTNESKATKGKADASQGKQAPDAAKDFMSGFLDRIKQDQGSSAAGSSEDKQDKDSNPNTGEAQTKETSPEKREAAANLKYAKDRHSKAYAAAKSKSPFGKKRRQEELNAATKELKKSELIYEAATKLDESREIYAEASVDFETRFFKGKRRQEELNAAAEELKKSGLEYMRLKFADKIEAAKQDPEKQAELAAEMGQAAFASMQETSRTTTDKYDSMLDDRGKFKKAAAKVGKWFNKGGRIAQLLKLGGTGFAVGATTATFAGWPITTAVGIVTELGVAGATKQAVLEEHRGEDRIPGDSLETIDPSFKDTVANMKIDDVMEHAVNVSVDNLKDVSIERQDVLRKKVRSSLGKYGVGFALGGFAGKFVGDWANSAHATGTESNTATPSQSGGEQIPQSGGEQVPQSGGASSVDSSVDKIVSSVNPDTSNFNSYDYPWDWAAEKFGNANAMDQLHNLADKAMANGHTVEWFNNPDGSAWMKVDGSSATADVLKVLNKYA